MFFDIQISSRDVYKYIFLFYFYFLIHCKTVALAIPNVTTFTYDLLSFIQFLKGYFPKARNKN